MKKKIEFPITFFAILCLSLPIAAQQVVGSIPGSFEVTLSGSATYVVPIRVAPGTAGVEPKLSLAYDSQQSGGVLGAGWSITGLSKITRGSKNARFDGTPDGVKLQESDALYLDGQRLVPIAMNGAGANRTIEYRKDLDDQTRIIETGADFNSATFLVTTKAGLTIEYDSVPGAPADQNRGDIRLSDGSALLRAETRLTDTSGNYIDFYYLVNGNGNYDIKSIKYTGHATTPVQVPYASVDFDYETAPRSQQTFVAGRALIIDTRLVSIVARVARKPSDPLNSTWMQVAHYSFDYESRDTANRFVLKTIHEFGEDSKELFPTTFTYSAPSVGWKDAAYTFPAILAAHEELSAGYRFVHVNTQNALPDLLYAARVGNKLEAFTFQNLGNGWIALDAFKSPVPFAADDGSDLGVILADVNGDGRVDILQATEITNQAPSKISYIAGGSGWDERPEYILPFTVAKDGKRIAAYQLARWSGGPGPDLLYQSGANVGFLANTASGWKSDDRYKPPVDLSRTILVDADCSGKPALISSVADEKGNLVWKAYKFGSNKWDEITDPNLLFPFPAQTSLDAIRLITVDKTACTGLLVASAQGQGLHAVFQASAKGWQQVSNKTPAFNLIDADGRSTNAIVAPFMSDGLSDVIADTTYSDGHVVKFAYLQESDGWKDASATFAVPVLASSTASVADQHIYVGDLTGSGRSDLLFPKNSRYSFGQIYLATDAGLMEKPDFTPPVFFATKGIQDQGVRTLDLNGHGLSDILVSRAGDPNASAWFNTGGGWKAEPGLIPPLPIAGTDITGNPVQFIDIDGDGYTDMLYSYRDKSGAVATKLYRNVPGADGMRTWSDAAVDGSGLSGLIPPTQYPFAGAKVGDLGVRFADLAGTGRPYMLVGFQPAGSQAAAILTAFRDDGTKWVAAPEFAPPVPFTAQIGPPNAASPDFNDPVVDLSVAIVDINNDGLPDLVANYHDPKNPSSSVQGVWLNTGHGWSKSPTISVPISLDTLTWNAQTQSLQWDKNASIQWADVNGDGIPDILYTRREGTSNESVTYLGTGTGWSPSGVWQTPLVALPDRGGDPGMRLVDINGDGYPDLLFVRQEDDGSTTKGLFINSGSGWISSDPTAVPNIPFVDKAGNDMGVRLLDLDGSGLLSLIQVYSGDTEMRAIKLNQAKRADIIQHIDAGYGLQTDIAYQAISSPQSPELDSSLQSISISFAWSGVYAPELSTSYPILGVTPAAYVVRRTILSESSTRHLAFSYRYGGLRMDALGKSSLGFAWQESVNELSGLYRRVMLSQDVDYAGKVLQENTCWLNVAVAPAIQPIASNPCTRAGAADSLWIFNISDIHSEWKIEKAQVGGGSLPSLTIRQISLTRTTSTTYELDRKVAVDQEDKFEYDEPQSGQTLLDRHLNTTRSLTTWGDGFTVETVNAFDDDVSRWFLGRLARSTVTRQFAIDSNGERPHPPEVRSVGFTYDTNSGLLSSQTVNLGTPREVTTSLKRDPYGNVIEEHLSAQGIPDHQPTVHTYDSTGRFLVSTTNPLLQKATQRLSVTTGLTERATDLNGTTVQYTYDGFGRLVQTDSPTGPYSTLSVITEYVPIASLDPSIPVSGIDAVYAVRVHTTDSATVLPAAIRLFDAKGRTLRTVTEAFHKDYITHRFTIRDIIYDIYGQATQVSLPYEQGAASQGWNKIERDALSRVTRRTSSDGGTIEISYSTATNGGVATTTIDHRRGHATTNVVVRNMRDLPLQITDTAGKHITFDYNAGGKPVTIKDPLGNVATYTYDDFGNRIAVSDPDAGKWTYEFDSLGRLTRQIDSDTAKTQITRIEYDALSRVRQETKADAVWTWEYDTADHGVGKIALIHDDAGVYAERYTYDEVGRVDAVDISVKGKTYTSSKRYDSYGRVSYLGYPDNFAITNVFDKGGFLISVNDASTGLNYWTLGATDNFGNVTSAQYGNGIVDSNAFDKASNRPLHLQSTGKANNSIVNLTLTYDVAGDLRRRVDTVQKRTDTFDYDDLDRLVSTSRSDGTRDIYTYDDGGRFRSKAGVNFLYPNGASNESADCVASPLPAHGVVATGEGKSQAIKYTYDCHGNMTSRGGDLYYYKSDGRLFRVERKSGPGLPENIYTHFDYAPSGARYREFAKHGARELQTISVNGYEETTEYGTGDLAGKACFVRYRWIINNLSGPFAIVEKSHQQCDGLIGTTFHEGAKHIGDAPFDVRKTWYLHKDQLGSILAVTDESGQLRAQYWYDPWGVKTGRVFDPNGVPSGARLEDSWNRGFTGQEQLEDFELIHMNGRVYDPHLGVFTSPDPIKESPDDTQLYNPFAYVRNNPLRYTDPSGYCFMGCFWQAPGKVVEGVVNGVGNAVSQGFKAVGDAFSAAGKWIGQNWRPIVVVAAVIVVTVVTAGTGGPAAASLGTAILSGMAAGATAGGLSAALYGGSVDDILAGAVKGAIIGGISGGALYGIGSLTAGGGALNGAEGIAGHGLIGGAREIAYGGNFWHGFESGALTKGSSLLLPTFDSGAMNIARAAVVGGGIAAIGGGNFGNGAVTGAFSYAFNDAMHPPVEDAIYPTASPIDFALMGAVSLYGAVSDFVGDLLVGEGIAEVETSEFTLLTSEEVTGPQLPDEIFSSKAPYQVQPGVDELTGQYINDVGRVEPWRASYDEYGRITARTDYNAGNSAQGIPDIHHHTYEWGPGMSPMETGSHIPGPWPGNP